MTKCCVHPVHDAQVHRSGDISVMSAGTLARTGLTRRRGAFPTKLMEPNQRKNLRTLVPTAAAAADPSALECREVAHQPLRD